MQRTFRIIKLIFLGISIFLCLAIPIVGLVSAFTSWDGVCYGFTDSSHGCSRWEFAWTEMFWALFLFIPLLFIAALVWILIAIIQFIMEKIRKKQQSKIEARS